MKGVGDEITAEQLAVQPLSSGIFQQAFVDLAKLDHNFYACAWSGPLVGSIVEVAGPMVHIHGSLEMSPARAIETGNLAGNTEEMPLAA